MKKAEAPAFIAIRRTDGSSLAVSIMTRVDGETLRNLVCTSSPFIFGIRMSITARLGRCIAACSKNAIGSVKISTLFQPAESRSRRVALRIEASSSSRYTAAVSWLSATIFYLPDHTQNRIRIRKWFCQMREQNRNVGGATCGMPPRYGVGSAERNKTLVPGLTTGGTSAFCNMTMSSATEVIPSFCFT